MIRSMTFRNMYRAHETFNTNRRSRECGSIDAPVERLRQSALDSNRGTGSIGLPSRRCAIDKQVVLLMPWGMRINRLNAPTNGCLRRWRKPSVSSGAGITVVRPSYVTAQPDRSNDAASCLGQMHPDVSRQSAETLMTSIPSRPGGGP